MTTPYNGSPMGQIKDRAVQGPTTYNTKPETPSGGLAGGVTDGVTGGIPSYEAMKQGRMGEIDMRGQGQTQYNTNGGLPNVSDPDKAFAAMTRADYMEYKKDYSQYEDGLIDNARNDTSLIDQAREDSQTAAGIAEGVAKRNASRYGAALTPAQVQEQEKALARGNTLGTSQAISDARVSQRELNTQKTADLINIGQGVNRTSLSQMGSAAADASSRNQAYANAKAQSKASTFAALGSLGSAAIIGMAF